MDEQARSLVIRPSREGHTEDLLGHAKGPPGVEKHRSVGI